MLSGPGLKAKVKANASFRWCSGVGIGLPFSFWREGDGGDVAAAAARAVVRPFPKKGGDSSASESDVTPPTSSPWCPPCCCVPRRGSLLPTMTTALCRLLLLLCVGLGLRVSLKKPLLSLVVRAAATAAAPSTWGDFCRTTPPALKVSAARGGRRFAAAGEHPSTLTGRSMGVLDTPFASKELS